MNREGGQESTTLRSASHRARPLLGQWRYGVIGVRTVQQTGGPNLVLPHKTQDTGWKADCGRVHVSAPLRDWRSL